MMDFPHLFLWCSLFFSLFTNSVAVLTIAANQSIRDGETIVSAAEIYELGFFSPSDFKYRYLGIWYKKISPRTVVWVANRERPLTNTSGVFQLSSEGTLLLLAGADAVIWSSNSSVRISSPVAQLLDTGNLVVSNGSMFGQEKFTWQSFDYPGDTILPGMKFGKDLVTGTERHLTSWKTPDDPSPGQFVHWMDTNGFPQVFERQGSVLRVRIGPWNGLQCSGWPNLITNPLFLVEFVLNQKEIYYKYELKSSVLQRIHLNWDGSLVMMNWIERTQSWFQYANALRDGCGRYALCGAYGICNIKSSPACSCMEGFEPKRQDEWNTSDWSSGCQHKGSLDCGKGEGFWKITGVNLPDTHNSWYNQSMTLDECEITCRSNCSCTAYANIDIRRGGSGCLLWFGELMDLGAYEDFQDLYVRMSASVLTDLTLTQSRSNKKKRVLTVVLSVSSVGLVLLGLSVAVYECSKKKKSSDMKGRGGWVHVQNENLELPFICFFKLVKATNSFSTENKLGEGGFGPVYKGVLEEGQEVAVKRLSKTSEQGLDEFQNEVSCIAKLQHRNLVKLLGYCIHGDEKILIYEYMPNKSLDSFLFDDTGSSMLDWPQRFSIIHGIARGLLYLHQDSRLRVIHRDLKAGNILLDYDMNPKISDFGLARRFGGNETAAKTKKVVGTYGYISPEYAVHGRFSTKSDVFSFGVLVLEIVSGKKNRGFSHDDHRDNLLGHAWRLYKEDQGLELMSASLRNSCVVSEVKRSIHVALLCVQHHAQDRPTMSSIVLMLGGDDSLASPRQPAFFTEESLDEPGSSSSSVDEATITLLDAR